MNKTLLVLAAGMGSRYGGIKQLDGFGPHNETIIEYSIYDAIRNGFDKVVFVIRKDIEKDFKECVLSKLEKQNIKIELAYQDLLDLPSKVEVKREKPWGTSHAIWSARDKINEPFMMINADDFYGFSAFLVGSKELENYQNQTKKAGIVGYILKNTMSKNGHVSRGYCETDGNKLTKIVEHKKIYYKGDEAYSDHEGKTVKLELDSTVSMNMFTFTPDILNMLENQIKIFLSESKDLLKDEALIPSDVNSLLSSGLSVNVMKTDAVWFGVTYAEDKPIVKENILKLIKEGKYPEKLF